jgi:hypothetical protein
MSSSSRYASILQHRGHRVGPVEAADLRAFRAIGAVLLLVAAIVTGFYAVDLDVAAYTTFEGELVTTHGTVTTVEPTDTYEPGTRWSRRDEHTRIVAVRYVFTDPTRTEQTGVSYLPDSRLANGTQVTIEYPVGQPDVSRIRGYRSAKLDRLPPALSILAGTGVALLLVGLLWRTAGDRAAQRA